MKDDFYINELKEIRSFCQYSNKEDIYLRIYQAERKIEELTGELRSTQFILSLFESNYDELENKIDKAIEYLEHEQFEKNVLSFNTIINKIIKILKGEE